MSARAAESMQVDSGLLERVLAPYKPHCRYLLDARIELATQADGTRRLGARGSFSIPESCYIEDTGHLNSVEANIAYNQLMYTMFALGVQHELVPELDFLDLEAYLERCLPDVLIHRIDLRFKRPISRLAFGGHIELSGANESKAFSLLKTEVRFEGAAEVGGLALGQVDLAFLHRPEDRPEGT